MTIFGNLNAARILNRFLNTVNDAQPGQALASPSGSIVQPYGGMLGQLIALSTAEALALSDTTIGTLYGGIYQYVQFKTGSTAANARGQIVFWDDVDKLIVSPDAAAANLSRIAGITLNVVSKGQYGWIQVAGKASVLMRAAVTKAASTTDGDLVLVDSTPTASGDVLADATALTSVEVKRAVGRCLAVIAQGAVGPVLLGFPKLTY